METFKKRQKEMWRLERPRDKAAKRKEIKVRKAAGITSESDRDTEATENAAHLTQQQVNRSRIEAILDRPKRGNSWRSGISALTRGRTPTCIGSTCAVTDA